MRRIQTAIVGLSTAALSVGLLATASFADGRNGGSGNQSVASGSQHNSGSGDSNDQNKSVATSSSNTQRAQDQDANKNDRDGDRDEHPIALGAAGASGPTGNIGEHRGDNRRRIQGTILRAALTPSSPTDPAIFGVNPGGAPWKLANGSARLDANGNLRVDIRGLVLTSTGLNPLPDLAASVYCNGTIAATTLPTAFSTHGNAQIRSKVTLPMSCRVPAVILNPATGSLAATVVTATFIAADGS